MAKTRARPQKAKATKNAPSKPLDKALGPAADEFGREVAPLGKRAGKLTAYVGDKLLGMLEWSVFGIERVAEWVHVAVSERLKNLPEEKLAEPNPRIAVPAVQALTYSMGEEHIREMFANLLAADMNSDLKESAHPAFVEIIKEMTPVDARLLDRLRKSPEVEFKVRIGMPRKWNELGIEYSFQIEGMAVPQIAASISNLERLGLIYLNRGEAPIRSELEEREKAIGEAYKHVEEQLEQAKQALKSHPEMLATMPNGKVFSSKSGIFLTPLGHMFTKVCLSEKGTG